MPSYTALGERLYGKTGKFAVNITVILSQAGFCCTYIWFIVSNVHAILSNEFAYEHDEWVTAMICLVGFTLLCWVRKIEIFASTHIFGDVMILFMLIYIISLGIIYYRDDT